VAPRSRHRFGFRAAQEHSDTDEIEQKAVNHQSPGAGQPPRHWQQPKAGARGRQALSLEISADPRRGTKPSSEPEAIALS